MPVTVTVDPNFIYGMLKEYNDAAMAHSTVGGSTLSMNLYFLDGIYIKYTASPNCSVSAVTGGAKIVCTGTDTSSNTYTINGAQCNIMRDGSIYYFFKVSFLSVTKGSGDTLTVTATAVLTVG